jgi:hypothetical protein
MRSLRPRQQLRLRQRCKRCRKKKPIVEHTSYCKDCFEELRAIYDKAHPHA